MLIQQTTALPVGAPAGEGKPLLRGWIHAIAAVGAVITTVALCYRSYGDTPRMISMLVYGLSTIALYGGSAVYHIGRWKGAWHRWLRAVDHTNIHLHIAGTYTPLCFNLLSGWLRVGLLASIWTLALLGILRVVFRPPMPRWSATLLYMAMGWLAVPALPIFITAVPLGVLEGLFVSGLLFSLGAVVYARRRPDPFPRVFGYHELFHLLVVGGGLIVFGIIWTWALTYPRA
jgi:hemolysin III